MFKNWLVIDGDPVNLDNVVQVLFYEEGLGKGYNLDLLPENKGKATYAEIWTVVPDAGDETGVGILGVKDKREVQKLFDSFLEHFYPATY